MSNINPSSTEATVGAIATFGASVENNIFYINATPEAGVTGTGIATSLDSVSRDDYPQLVFPQLN